MKSLSIRLSGECQEDAGEEDIGKGDCVMRVWCNRPRQVHLARGWHGMDDTEECKEGAGERTQCRKSRLAIDQKGKHASPEERREDKTVTEHGEALIHDLQADGELVGCDGHGAQKLAENNNYEVGNDWHET